MFKRIGCFHVDYAVSPNAKGNNFDVFKILANIDLFHANTGDSAKVRYLN